MAFTLGDLKTKLNFALGTSETNLMTVEKRTDALNRSIQIILEQYAIPQYVISTALSFTAGIANLPTDCLQPLKLVDPTQNSNDFKRVNWDSFADNVSNTYTITWDTAGSKEVIKSYPTNYTTLTFWYIMNPPTLVSDSDFPRFNSWWMDAIVEKAAEKLLTDVGTFNRAEAKQATADNLIAKAWQNERQRIVGPEENKLTSVFSKKKSLLQGRSTITTN